MKPGKFVSLSIDKGPTMSFTAAMIFNDDGQINISNISDKCTKACKLSRFSRLSSCFLKMIVIHPRGGGGGSEGGSHIK